MAKAPSTPAADAPTKPARARRTAKPASAEGSVEAAPAGTLRDQAARFAKNAGEKAKGYADSAKDTTTGALHGLSGMAEDVAKTIDARVGAGYGDYVRKAASTVSGIADSLDSKTVDDLVADTRRFVKERPAVAIGAAVAAGFLLTRLFRAGRDDDDE